MNKCILAALVCIAAFATIPSAMAQCPAGLADPLYLINNTNWAFQYSQDNLGEGAVGLFNATVKVPSSTNPFYTGVLNINETYNDGGTVNRGLNAVGKYQIYPDCSGGELLFTVNGYAFWFEFVFVTGRTEMYFVSDNTGVRNLGLGYLSGEYGRAILTPAPACPAGNTDPRTVFLGGWGFQAVDGLSGSVGTMNPAIVSGTGILNVSETTTLGQQVGAPQVLRGQVFPGKYIVYPDCSGGELLFNVGRNSVQYEFVFAGSGYNQILMVSDNTMPFNVGAVSFRGNRGWAKRAP